jgi:hypothetical protein
MTNRLTATETARRVEEVLRVVIAHAADERPRPISAADLVRLMAPFVGLN